MRRQFQGSVREHQLLCERRLICFCFTRAMCFTVYCTAHKIILFRHLPVRFMYRSEIIFWKSSVIFSCPLIFEVYGFTFITMRCFIL
jgi:hypothetical protein